MSWIIFASIACVTLSGIIGLIASCLVPAGFLLGFFFTPLVKAGFKAKIINAKNKPLELSYTQVERYFNTFRDIVSDHEVSLEAFSDYIALLARSKIEGGGTEGSAQALPGQRRELEEFDVKFTTINEGSLLSLQGTEREMTEHEQQAARSVIQLSPLTRSIAQEIVEKHAEKSIQRILRQREIMFLKEQKFITLTSAECDALVVDCANDLGGGDTAMGFEVGLPGSPPVTLRPSCDASSFTFSRPNPGPAGAGRYGLMHTFKRD